MLREQKLVKFINGYTLIYLHTQLQAVEEAELMYTIGKNLEH